ncbi:carboxylesterase [Coniophora puteana RWD-64-598 SS2]|uniref:Carboxylesterase n=1 Tax=Coniophora puteana (strain RWD-64-598) TaxID=741705 RepID=A0A5M3MJZ3_CONPW|nr:carboxylesterase [Coniophora puteana RWD-64-598 SS2]EIW79549.1 carboxylesterase [Coniophora puteana RWD-64-598 SS2]
MFGTASFLLAFTAAFGGTGVFAQEDQVAPLDQYPYPDPLIRNTTTGTYNGYLDTNTTGVPLYKWYGMHFAATTAGANAWRPPQPYDVPEGVQNATAMGDACMQGEYNAGNGTQNQSEDCLFVNVVAPVGATNLPVYVYSFGGGFTGNAASDPKIDGSWLASRDIVYVSYNYRLALWAFPNSIEIAEAGETQNLAVLDTRAAVEWAYNNVAQFGGDPTKITFGGESVGAEMTLYYLNAYWENPLIRGAVMQSSDTSQPMWQTNNQLDIISRNVSCPTSGNGQLDCLRTKDPFELQAVLIDSGAQFQPVIDNITVFRDPVRLQITGQTTKVPLLIGNNMNEGQTIVNGEPTSYTNETAYIMSNNFNFPMSNIPQVLSMYPSPSPEYPSIINATSAMWRDAHMICLSSNLALWRTQLLKLPVWRYEFALVADNLNAEGASIGTFHGEDIQFVMGTLYTIADQAPYIPATPFEWNVSDYMVTAWTNFIKDPEAGPRIEGWRQYDPADPTSLAVLGISETGAIPGNASDIDHTCAYWNQILPLFPEIYPECGTWTCES